MSIKSWFKSFKRKEDIPIVYDSSSVINPLDIFPMPIRESFNNDRLIDFYKNLYTKKLKNLSAFDVLGLAAGKLKSGISMTIDLLLAIIANIDDITKITSDERLEYLIRCNILDLLQNDIDRMQKEATARLIALNEIRSNKLFISQEKKEIIDREINTLYISLYTLASQEYSLRTSVKNYETQSKYNYSPTQEEIQKEYELLDEEIKRLNYLQQILPQEIRITIRKDINYVLKDIAIVRRNLAIYAYDNAYEVAHLKKRLTSLQEGKNHDTNKGEKDEEINKLELKFLVFYEFGYNLLTKDDIEKFYNYKFSHLTSDPSGLTEIFINAVPDNTAKDNYQRIILSMIETILKGKNSTLVNLYWNSYGEVISLLLQVLKNNTDNIDPEAILNNYYLLNFLISFYNNTLTNFWNITGKEHIHEMSSTWDENMYEIFRWKREIPLKTFLFIKHFEKKDLTLHHNYNEYEVSSSLSDFYYFYQRLLSSAEYYLPEGLTVIDTDKYSITKWQWEKDMLDDMAQNSIGKVLVFPESLAGIESDYLDAKEDFLFRNSLKGINKSGSICLNNGLKSLSGVDLSKESFPSLELPPSIEHLSETKFNKSAIKTVIINDIFDNYDFRNSSYIDCNSPFFSSWLFDLFFTFSAIFKKRGKYYLRSDFPKIIFHNTQDNTDFVFNQELATIEINEEEVEAIKEYIRSIEKKSRHWRTDEESIQINKGKMVIRRLEKLFYEELKYALKEERDKQKSSVLLG